MPERRSGVGEHPSVEVLSAYVDGTLDAGERGDVETHLAACEACYELVTEVVASAEDIGAEGDVAPPAAPVAASPLTPEVSREVASTALPSKKVLPFTRRRWVIVVAAGVAAAAALVLAVRLGLPSGENSAAVEKLVAAVGDQRTIEGRLSGAFQHGPLRSATRSGSPVENLALLAAAGELQRTAESAPSAEGLHAFGVAQLLLGKHPEAVTTLERAVAADPRAPILSDLSAAYIERGRHLGVAEDWPRSLAAAEKAIRLDPGLLSAWFNRACAIESFGVAAPSRDAWNDYLQRDGSSAWAEEARQRLSGIKPSAELIERWQRESTRYLEGTPTAADAAGLVSTNSQASRELLEDEIWPGMVAAAGPEHTLWRQRADLLVTALHARTKDALLVESHARTVRGESSAILRDAFSRWKTAKALYAANRVVDMTPAFAEVASAFGRAQTPMRHWAEHYRLIGLFYQGKLPEATELGRSLIVESERSGYTALLPRVRWDLGTILYQQARFEEALHFYKAAGEGFEAIGEFENATAINQLIGEALGRLGDGEGSWSFHRRALGRYDIQRDPRRRHTLLAGAGHSALNLGMGEAALPFFRAAVPNALAWQSPGPILEAYLNQARAQLVLGERTEALLTLADARPWLPRVPDQAMKDRYGADFALAEAEALLTVDPKAGLAAADRAFAQYRTVASEFRLSALHLLRSRLGRQLGDDAGAEQDLAAGIELLESKRARVTQRSLRVSFLDTVWGLYDDMVSLQIERGRTAEALQWSERGRSRALLDAMTDASGSPSDPRRIPPLLAAGQAVLYFHATPTDVLAWLVMPTGIEVYRQPIARATLIEHIQAMQRAIEGGPGMEVTGAALYDVLLRPMTLDQRGLTHVVIVPHGQMEFIPFAALWNAERRRFVVQDLSVSVVPSLSMFEALQADRPPRAMTRVAVITTPDDVSKAAGLPPLRAVAAEANEIRALYPDGRIVEPGRATESSLLAALSDAEVVHFAGHAIADAAYPWHARLLLAPDEGAPTAMRVEQLPTRVRASVVVLAACRTARGASSWGEGVTSLVTPFLQAGVEAVIATLGNVQDEQMRTVSTAFHRALASGLSPAGALRAAQLSVIDHQSKSALPLAWAGVTAYGVR